MTSDSSNLDEGSSEADDSCPSDKPVSPEFSPSGSATCSSKDSLKVSGEQTTFELGNETEPQRSGICEGVGGGDEPMAASGKVASETDIPVDDRWSLDVTIALTGLGERLEHLQASFNEKIRYDTGREAIIDRLHSEIQEYKADLVFKILRPFALDLINLHEDVGKIVASHRDKAQDSETSEKSLSLLAEFQLDIEDTLARNGFSSFNVPQDEFDPKRQRVLKKVTTDDPSLERTVANRIRKGFEYEDRVVRPEMVAVYVRESRSDS